MLDILELQTTAVNPTVITIIYTVLLAFLLSTMIAFTYQKTFRGLSYSRNYLQALVLSSIVASTVMQAIGDSLASGLGMLGALAIIRFRTSLKEPRDIIFMFACLAAGIACGVNGYDIAVVGTLAFCVIAFVLHYSPFGQESCFDGMLRFNCENDPEGKTMLDDVLKDHCKIFALITLRDMAQGKRLDYAYHVKLKKGKSKTELVNALNRIESISGVSLLLQETTIDI
jgi:uncharacterized membrane protein YhiD involved in acid resistance